MNSVRPETKDLNNRLSKNFVSKKKEKKKKKKNILEIFRFKGFFNIFNRFSKRQRILRKVKKMIKMIELKNLKKLKELKELKKPRKLRILKPVKYFFVIGSSKFLLDNEPLEEILRERVQQYAREKKPIDFWIIKSPKFLNSFDLIDIKNKLTKDGLGEAELSAIVSLDEVFIKWMKLRLQNVAESNFMAFTKDIESPLASEDF